MKKHNEGYALALVLVVLVIVCLVAVSILSISLSNLKSQQASIARMQAQYEAQGKIEQVVAKLEQEIKTYENGFDKEDLDVICEGLAVPGEITKSEDALTFSLTAVSAMVQIDCTLEITGTIDDSQLENGVTLYNISDWEIIYTSYEITTIATETTNNGEGSEPA